MSSVRRRNGPRPSHGDICCSGSGTRGVQVGQTGQVGANGLACENMTAWENGLTGANGLAGSNRSAGSKASTGVRESNEVGESSGDQVVELRWVNDNSCDHIESYQASMVESHGENAESHPHNEELRNKAYNAFDPIVFFDGNTFD
ncbi:hypothetical protein Tco_0090450 [Tanacetum coccineum]